MKSKVSPTQQVLNVWALILIFWSVFRAYYKTDLPVWIDEFVVKPSIFILPLYYYITRFEKKHFFSAVDIKLKGNAPDILLGIAIGLVFFVTGAAAHYVKFKTFMPDADKISTVLTILYFVGISLASSVSEEILSRGFVLKRLYAESKNMFTSSFFASFLFFFLHIPILFTNQHIVGPVLLQVMMTDIILSIAVSFIYLQRGNVLLPILIHAFYNLSIYFFV